MTRLGAACLLLLLMPRQTAVDLERLPFAPRTAICYRASGRLTIDGAIDEPSWRAAPWSDPFVDIEGDARFAPRFTTRMKLLWDDEYLYLAADLEEPDIWGTISTRDAVIYQDNDFEVFIDPDGDSHEYYELEINALNTVWDLMLIDRTAMAGPDQRLGHRGVEDRIHLRGTLNRPGDKDDGWSVEIALPWAALKEAAPAARAPRAGEQWRINFSRVQWQLDHRDGRYAKRIDAQGSPVPENNWVWSPQGAIDMHMPERLGYVQFSNSSADSFRANPDEATRWALRRLYYRQADYMKTHGSTRTLAALGPLPVTVAGAQLHATDDLYVLTAPSPSGGIITLRQDGRIWRTDKRK